MVEFNRRQVLGSLAGVAGSLVMASEETAAAEKHSIGTPINPKAASACL
jgi:hypothetical protein